MVPFNTLEIGGKQHESIRRRRFEMSKKTSQWTHEGSLCRLIGCGEGFRFVAGCHCKIALLILLYFALSCNSPNILDKLCCPIFSVLRFSIWLDSTHGAHKGYCFWGVYHVRAGQLINLLFTVLLYLFVVFARLFDFAYHPHYRHTRAQRDCRGNNLIFACSVWLPVFCPPEVVHIVNSLSPKHTRDRLVGHADARWKITEQHAIEHCGKWLRMVKGDSGIRRRVWKKGCHVDFLNCFLCFRKKILLGFSYIHICLK